MINRQNTIDRLNVLADMLWELYRSATDRQDIKDRFEQYDTVTDAIELLKQDEIDMQKLAAEAAMYDDTDDI